jgi:hypothetical protein
MTAVLPCTCKSEYQDKAYGLGKRLHNKTNEGQRCTVCETEKK